MIVRTLEELIGTEEEVGTDNWVSRRFLLRRDNMGFSLHETTVRAGTETYIWYKHHLEAVYCVGGEGEVETIDDGKVYPIRDGSMYALNRNEKHWLRAKSDMRLVCVFNPPLVGPEVHNEEGVYELIDDEPAE